MNQIANKGNKAEKTFMLFLLIISLLILMGFLPIRLGVFSDIAEKTLKEAGADSAAVGGVYVSLFRGVGISDIQTYKRISENEEYRIRVKRIDVSCNLLKLAAAIPFKHFPFSERVDIFHDAYRIPLGFMGAMCDYWMSAVPVKKITMHGAAISAAGRKGQPGFAASGLSAEIGKTGRRLNGSIAAAEAVVPSLAKVEKFKITLRAIRKKDENRLDFINGKGSVFGGKLEAALSIAISAEKNRLIGIINDNGLITGGRVQLKSLDLKRFSAETGFSPGTVSGKASFDVQVEKSRLHALDSIRASAAVTVTNLTAADLALQKTAAVNQVSRDLRTLQFSKITGDINLYGGKINFNEIAGVGDVLSFKSVGWIDFDGKLQQNFDGEFSPEFVSALPKLIRNSLGKTDGGGGSFKCRITGTFHKPRVEIDRTVYNRAFKNFFK